MKIRYVWDFNKALADGAYAWPGGYPRYFVCADGGALSFLAANDNAGLIRDAIIAGPNTGRDNDQWRVIGVEINWEDDALTCDHSGQLIECAYAKDTDAEPHENQQKATPDNSGMREVSADEWAAHTADFRTVQTESVFRPGYSIMYSKLSPNGGYARPGYVVAEVHYMPNDQRAYFIR